MLLDKKQDELVGKIQEMTSLCSQQRQRIQDLEGKFNSSICEEKSENQNSSISLISPRVPTRFDEHTCTSTPTFQERHTPTTYLEPCVSIRLKDPVIATQFHNPQPSGEFHQTRNVDKSSHFISDSMLTHIIDSLERQAKACIFTAKELETDIPIGLVKPNKSAAIQSVAFADLSNDKEVDTESSLKLYNRDQWNATDDELLHFYEDKAKLKAELDRKERQCFELIRESVDLRNLLSEYKVEIKRLRNYEEEHRNLRFQLETTQGDIDMVQREVAELNDKKIFDSHASCNHCSNVAAYEPSAEFAASLETTLRILTSKLEAVQAQNNVLKLRMKKMFQDEEAAYELRRSTQSSSLDAFRNVHLEDPTYTCNYIALDQHDEPRQRRPISSTERDDLTHNTSKHESAEYIPRFIQHSSKCTCRDCIRFTYYNNRRMMNRRLNKYSNADYLSANSKPSYGRVEFLRNASWGQGYTDGVKFPQDTDNRGYSDSDEVPQVTGYNRGYSDSIEVPQVNGYNRKYSDSVEVPQVTGYNRRYSDSVEVPQVTGYNQKYSDSVEVPRFTGYNRKYSDRVEVSRDSCYNRGYSNGVELLHDAGWSCGYSDGVELARDINATRRHSDRVHFDCSDSVSSSCALSLDQSAAYRKSVDWMRGALDNLKARFDASPHPRRGRCTKTHFEPHRHHRRFGNNIKSS